MEQDKIGTHQSIEQQGEEDDGHLLSSCAVVVLWTIPDLHTLQGVCLYYQGKKSSMNYCFLEMQNKKIHLPTPENRLRICYDL